MAEGEDQGHWVLKHTLEAVTVDPIVVDGSAGTALYATFDPDDAPGHVHTMSLGEVPIGSTAAGRAPQYTQTSLNPVTHRLYVSQYGSATVSVIDTTTGAQVHSFEKENWMPWSAAVDTTRDLVYVVDGNDNDWNPSGSITVINGETNEIITEVSAPNGLAYPAVSEKHRRLYVPIEGEAKGTILIFNTETNTVAEELEPDAIRVPLMAIVDDTLDRLFVLQIDPATDRGSILMFDTTTHLLVNEPVLLDADHTVADAGMAYDPSSKQLYAAVFTSSGLSNTLVTIDVTTGAIIARDAIPAQSGAELRAAAPVPFSSLQIGIDSASRTLFVTTTDNRILSYEWRMPTPAPAPSQLADTGASVDLGVAVLAAMLAGGSVLILASRRRGLRSGATPER